VGKNLFEGKGAPLAEKVLPIMDEEAANLIKGMPEHRVGNAPKVEPPTSTTALA